MKTYPSVWITKKMHINENNDIQAIYDISVKMSADMEPSHFYKVF